MDIVRRVQSMRETARQERAKGRRIGLVPTMGYLHEGHVGLIRRIHEQADVVVVSIFVNPTQFGPEEDFDSYPRDLTRDTDLCIRENVDYLFTPSSDEIYPPGPRTYVDIPELGTRLEGASRPGHFRGVATVVVKLLNIVRPHVTAFGEKDAQQLAVVRRLIDDLRLGIELLSVPTARDERGLALSSRNRYLSAEQYEAALAIPRALEAARETTSAAEADAARVTSAARAVLEAEALLETDYVELVHPTTLEPVAGELASGLLLVAVRCGGTRLIDNTMIEPTEQPG
ncbi:MAG TPA: pantoate--beta-alanine ligase [Candidatus Polarisedimenticolaceae bacterium]|nr:pantoate--beta-alanine ligase [Candidatus Polarisedimenticolaceae bacterium]